MEKANNMKKNELENLIKENFKDTALRIYELDNEDRKSLLAEYRDCLLYTSPSPRDGCRSRMPSSA